MYLQNVKESLKGYHPMKTPHKTEAGFRHSLDSKLSCPCQMRLLPLEFARYLVVQECLCTRRHDSSNDRQATKSNRREIDSTERGNIGIGKSFFDSRYDFRCNARKLCVGSSSSSRNQSSHV